MFDVGVVGAGIIGCAVAEELGRRGARVVVFDARGIGGGATQASAGMLAPYIEGHERGPLFEHGVRSLALYDGFIERVTSSAGRPVEYRRCGTLELADSEERAQALRAQSRDGRAGLHAPPHEAEVDWIPAAGLRGFEPSVSADLLGARHCRSHGYVVVKDLVAALVASAERFGAVFHPGSAVAQVDAEAGGFRVRTTEDVRVRHVVVCAGSWTSQLGVAAELQDQVRPVRGQLVRLGWRGEPLGHVLWSSACYVVPWLDGTVLVGATAEDVGFDERATVAGVRDLLGAVSEILPPAWNADFLDVRVGLRPASSDGLPIVRASERVPGVFFATGHYRNGILLAPLTAVQVADSIA